MRLWRHLIGGQCFVIAYLADNLSGARKCSFPLRTAERENEMVTTTVSFSFIYPLSSGKSKRCTGSEWLLASLDAGFWFRSRRHSGTPKRNLRVTTLRRARNLAHACPYHVLHWPYLLVSQQLHMTFFCTMDKLWHYPARYPSREWRTIRLSKSKRLIRSSIAYS